jgi:hypothetical protein
MKTSNLIKLRDELKILEEDLKNRNHSFLIKKSDLAGECVRRFEYYVPLFNEFAEANDWGRIFQILQFLDTALGISEPVIQLKCFPEKKESLPGKPKNPGPITDKQFFDEILKFGKSFLDKGVFQEITSGIEWDSKEKVVKGSKPEFIILCGDFDKNNGDKCRTLTAYQLWQANPLFHGKNWVDSGYYINGDEINSQTAKHFIQQLEKLGWHTLINGILEFPVKIDLYGLTFNKNKNGLIYFTEESIYTQTAAFQSGNYNFQDVDEYGINIKSNFGKTHSVPSGKGCFRCVFAGDLYSNAVIEDLRDSNPNGLVIRELA